MPLSPGAGVRVALLQAELDSVLADSVVAEQAEQVWNRLAALYPTHPTIRADARLAVHSISSADGEPSDDDEPPLPLLANAAPSSAGGDEPLPGAAEGEEEPQAASVVHGLPVT